MDPDPKHAWDTVLTLGVLLAIAGTAVNMWKGFKRSNGKGGKQFMTRDDCSREHAPLVESIQRLEGKLDKISEKHDRDTEVFRKDIAAMPERVITTLRTYGLLRSD